MEGIIVKDEECAEEPINEEFKYLLEVDNQFRRIDVSSEGKLVYLMYLIILRRVSFITHFFFIFMLEASVK